jgi:hypothetical protein
MAVLYSVPTQDFLQKTLDAALNTGVTASATLNNMTGVQNLPGIFIVDRVNTNDVETPSKREVIAYTATSGVTVTTLTRGLAGTSDQDHAVGAIVEFAADVVWAQSIYDALSNLVVPSTQAVDLTKVVTPGGTQTLTNKTLTAPIISTISNTGTVTLPTTTDTLVGKATTDTLTNKRITSRVQSVSDAATITPDADANDCVDITAIAQAFTIANPTGTPTNFQKLIIRIKDNGTARAITFGSSYVAGGTSLPTTTVLSKILNLGFIYNTANSLNKWQLVASSQEA